MNHARKTGAIVDSEKGDLPQDFPSMPQEVRDRFPSAAEWEENMNRWWTHTKERLGKDIQTLSMEMVRKEDVESLVERSVTRILSQGKP